MGGAPGGAAEVAEPDRRLECCMAYESPEIVDACQFHPWDAMAPVALAAIVRRGPFKATAETGCGGSTILLSRASRLHTVFAIEGADRTISTLQQHPQLRGEAVVFVDCETKHTLSRSSLLFAPGSGQAGGSCWTIFKFRLFTRCSNSCVWNRQSCWRRSVCGRPFSAKWRMRSPSRTGGRSRE